MLRELSHLLDELHDGLNAIELQGGVRLSKVDMTLPLELRPVFRDDGCVLLADVPRQRAVDEWVASPSKLVIGWSAEGAGADNAAAQDTRESVFDRHPRESGDPATFASADDTEAAIRKAESLGPRLRGDDERKATSMGRRLHGDDVDHEATS